jgi:hypothetical protein
MPKNMILVFFKGLSRRHRDTPPLGKIDVDDSQRWGGDCLQGLTANPRAGVEARSTYLSVVSVSGSWRIEQRFGQNT